MILAPAGVGMVGHPFVLLTANYTSGPNSTILGTTPRIELGLGGNPESNLGSYEFRIQGLLEFTHGGSVLEPSGVSIDYQLLAYAFISGAWQIVASPTYTFSESYSHSGAESVPLDHTFTASGVSSGLTKFGAHQGAVAPSDAAVTNFVATELTLVGWSRTYYP